MGGVESAAELRFLFLPLLVSSSWPSTKTDEWASTPSAGTPSAQRSRSSLPRPVFPLKLGGLSPTQIDKTRSALTRQRDGFECSQEHATSSVAPEAAQNIYGIGSVARASDPVK